MITFRSDIEHQIIHEQKIYSLQGRNFTISNDGSKIIYINDGDELRKGNVFIRSKSDQSSTIDISSGISKQEANDDLISLVKGKTYVFNPDGSFSSTNYLNQNVLLSNKVPNNINNDLESKSFMNFREG